MSLDDFGRVMNVVEVICFIIVYLSGGLIECKALGVF